MPPETEIVIIDYGMGNLESVANALRRLGCRCQVSHHEKDILSATAYILPGVGAFGEAMKNISQRGLIPLLEEEVLKKKKPLLGICLGMQLLAKDSEENGHHQGLGWIDATVRKLEVGENLRLPHVGWNTTNFTQQTPLFQNIHQNSTFYFDHNYHMICHPNYILATSIYGTEVIAAIQKDNILAAQFHPEKSQINGLKMLRNFLNFVHAKTAIGSAC